MDVHAQTYDTGKVIELKPGITKSKVSSRIQFIREKPSNGLIRLNPRLRLDRHR